MSALAQLAALRPDASPAGRAALIADLAVAALVNEAQLSPKPGLVDRRGNGAHIDLTLALMCRSATALRPAFVAMAEAGMCAAAPIASLRESLGRIGRDAEATMMATTGGANTHRGAIWALGLLTGAAGVAARSSVDAAQVDAGQIASLAARIAAHPDRHAPGRTGHKGEQACEQFNVAGARGQARAGFPHVMALGLPELRRSRARGDSETASRLNALLAVMSRLDDTCILSRGGMSALRRVQHGAASVLSAGGVATLAGRRLLSRLDAEALRLHVSPGGSADLLAATLLVDGIERWFAAQPLPHRLGRPDGKA